jgi:hypothetical protein
MSAEDPPPDLEVASRRQAGERPEVVAELCLVGAVSSGCTERVYEVRYVDTTPLAGSAPAGRSTRRATIARLSAISRSVTRERSCA